MKILKAGLLFRPGSKQPYRSESQTVQIRLSGRWLEALGFKPGAPVYIEETEKGLTLSANPPEDRQLTPLDEIKAKYQHLGIPTIRKK